MRILLPEKPEETIVTDDEGNKISDLKKSWDAESNTQYLRYANSPDGINVTLKW